MYSKPNNTNSIEPIRIVQWRKKQEIDDVVFGKDILSTGIAPVVQNSCGKKKDKICPLY